MAGDKPKRMFYLLLSISMASILLIIASLYLGNKNLDNSAEQTSKLMAERDVSREKINRLEQIRRQSRDVNENEQAVQLILPETKKQQTLVAEIIYSATREADISSERIRNFDLSGSTEASSASGDLSGTEKVSGMTGVYSYPFSMRVDSISYSQIIKLLKAIEGNQRLIQVSETAITAAEDGKLNLALTMEAYIQP